MIDFYPVLIVYSSLILHENQNNHLNFSMFLLEMPRLSKSACYNHDKHSLNNSIPNLSFCHKLNSVANDCNFTNKDEIVKFLFLTHNQNTRDREHLLRNSLIPPDWLTCCIWQESVRAQSIQNKFLNNTWSS